MTVNMQDAMFNWIQMKIVSEARPDDLAAKDTLDFFEEILREDHRLSHLTVDTKDEFTLQVRYSVDESEKVQEFDKESAAQLLADIESNPKYNE